MNAPDQWTVEDLIEEVRAWGAGKTGYLKASFKNGRIRYVVANAQVTPPRLRQKNGSLIQGMKKILTSQ